MKYSARSKGGKTSELSIKVCHETKTPLSINLRSETTPSPLVVPPAPTPTNKTYVERNNNNGGTHRGTPAGYNKARNGVEEDIRAPPHPSPSPPPCPPPPSLFLLPRCHVRVQQSKASLTKHALSSTSYGASPLTPPFVRQFLSFVSSGQ